MTLSETIENFSHEIKRQIELNSDKGNLLEWNDIGHILYELDYHKAKLLIAIKQNNPYAIKEYIADCASILLALGNCYGIYNEKDTTKTKVNISYTITLTTEGEINGIPFTLKY